MKRSSLIAGLGLFSLTLIFACGKPEEPAKAQKPAATQQQAAEKKPAAESKPAAEPKAAAPQAAPAHQEAEHKEPQATQEPEKKEPAEEGGKSDSPPPVSGPATIGPGTVLLDPYDAVLATIQRLRDERRIEKSVREIATPTVSKDGKIIVRRTFTESGEIVKEEEGDSMTIEMPNFVGPTANVSVDKGATINLGDYNSAKINVFVSVPCYLLEDLHL